MFEEIILFYKYEAENKATGHKYTSMAKRQFITKVEKLTKEEDEKRALDKAYSLIVGGMKQFSGFEIKPISEGDYKLLQTKNYITEV